MQHITQIIQKYKKEVEQIEQSNLRNLTVLNDGLNLSIDTLNQLRKQLRTTNCFNNQEEEIHFFKADKPFINGRIKFFSKVRRFIFEKPNASIVKQIDYASGMIDKLEKHKMRNLEFFQYARHCNTSLDHIYFIRGNDKLDFPVDTSHYFTDPEFSTSHDNLAAQVISYDLLSNYYQLELKSLRKQNENIIIEEISPAILNGLSWTASKTDLVELIYALHSSGAIRNGQAEISKIAEVCATLFDINLNNFYKTYAEIRNREKDTTKFLNQLKRSLEIRIDLDDAK
ncbi:RteC domain-containing protein [Algibacter sp. L1A34]|uniref:RteC domain-containing protein n=1 Tax=Algibacter sp. L1A34 TaxID=2686365 RepID=UPI001E4BDBCC|nr:RteC domain-containing protein [Algibacter sp. L1A34]